MKFLKEKPGNLLWIIGVYLFVAFQAQVTRADCGCQIGSNGIYVMGYEFIATGCPSDPPSDNTNYRYLINPINCVGNKITKFTSYGDTTGTPASIISFYISNGYRVLRNPSGTHLLLIQNKSNPFTGIVAGINMAVTPAGVYYTNPAENLNEYCTAFPLPDQDNDYFPDCLDCAPAEVSENAVCSADPEFLLENNFGPSCPVPSN